MKKLKLALHKRPTAKAKKVRQLKRTINHVTQMDGDSGSSDKPKARKVKKLNKLMTANEARLACRISCFTFHDSLVIENAATHKQIAAKKSIVWEAGLHCRNGSANETLTRR